MLSRAYSYISQRRIFAGIVQLLAPSTNPATHLAEKIPFWATVSKTVRPMLSVRCLSVCLSCVSVTLVHCRQTVGWIKTKLGMQVGLSPGHIVLDRDPAAPQQKGGGASPNSVHVYCGQTAGWIKMPLGTEVGLGSEDIVLDKDPAPLPKKGAESPSPFFGPFILWPNGWMHQDDTCYGGRPQPRELCV